MIDDALRPDVSVVAANDAGDGGKPNSRAGEILVPMQPIEGIEKLARIGHVKSRAVVADEPCLFFLVPAEVDDGAWLLRTELDGVTEQVFKRDL